MLDDDRLYRRTDAPLPPATKPKPKPKARKSRGTRTSKRRKLEESPQPSEAEADEADITQIDVKDEDGLEDADRRELHHITAALGSPRNGRIAKGSSCAP